MYFIKDLIYGHRIALVSACVVGLIIAAPIIITPLFLGDKYQGVQFIPLDDEDIYRARINEVLDGYTFVTSPYLYEYKDSSVVVPPINEWIYALPAFLIGLSGSIILLKFLLPAVLFFLVYLLVYRLTKRNDEPGETVSVLIASLSTAFVVTLGMDLIGYTYLGRVLQGGVVSPIIWSRLVNPVVGAVQLFSFLILLEAIVSRRLKYAYVFAGVLLSITVGYFFTLGMSLAVLGSLFLISAYKKEWMVARELMCAGVIGIVLSIWYWINIFSSIGGVEGAELATRNGMSFTHAPVVNKALLAGTLFVVISAIVVYLRPRTFMSPKSWAFVTSLLMGCWISFNQQIITGREIWYGHFWQYSMPIIYVAMGVTSYYSWRFILPKIWYWLSLAVIVVTVSYGLFSISQFVPREAEFIRIQEYATLFAWLNENAKKDCVVYVHDDNEELEKLIPAYTFCNVYSTSYNFLGIPIERVEHNFFVDLRMNGVKNDTLAEYMITNETDVRGVFYTNWEELFDSGKTDWLLQTIENVEQEYAPILQEDTQDLILQYRVDYIISRGKMSEWAMSGLPAFSHSTSTEHYSIYVK